MPNTPPARADAEKTTPFELSYKEAHVGAESGGSAAGPSRPPLVDPEPAFLDAQSRYRSLRLLGAGGMGEVNLCADAWVGRDVAMKMMHRGDSANLHARTRFLREARVQGQLEHPSIVPVYDLGVARDGAEFFTMKRVKGQTLEEIFLGLRGQDPQLSEEYSQRKLLAAMSRACLAVAFAHERGVIHRDLKPSNIMLGDFGEVYVLDWGIAKILKGTELEQEPSRLAVEPRETADGALVGTAGYMCPEQAHGDQRAVSPRSDIYSLGAILFELLAQQPLHPATTVEAALASTLAGVDASPRHRAPQLEVAPELDEICLRATAQQPAARYQDAKQMAKAIDAYLDGERDAERRERLATQHLQLANEMIEGASGDGSIEMQIQAMRELSRALALRPDDQKSLGLLMQWLSAPPSEIPRQAQEALAEVERQDRLSAGRRAFMGYLGWYLVVPFVAWMGVRNWSYLIALVVMLSLAAGYTWWMVQTGSGRAGHVKIALALHFGLLACVGTIFGPFFLVPAMVLTTAAIVIPGMRADSSTRWFILLFGLGAVFIPALVQWVGWLPRSYVFEANTLRILPGVVEFRPLPTLCFMSVVIVLQLVLNVRFMGAATRHMVQSERRTFINAWRMRQLLPPGASM